MSCRGFLQCILKIVNFFLTLVGAGMVVYSLWMLNEWYKHPPAPTPTPTPAPSPAEVYASGVRALMELPLLPQAVEMAEAQEVQTLATLSFVMDQGTRLKSVVSLPAPWFIFAFLGAGGIACFVTCIGHIAAETANSCCLCFYTTLLGFLLVVQAAVTATIFFDNHWRDDLPADPTGEVEKLYAFVQENYEIIQWIGLAVLILQGLALLFSLILRAVADSRKSGYDSDDDYLPRTQRQAVQRQATTTGNGGGGGGDATAENRPAARSDEWSKRMREKYGLDTNEFTYNPGESRRFAQPGGAAAAAPTGEEKKNCCTIM